MSMIPELMGGRRLIHGVMTEGRIKDATSTGYNSETLAAAKTLTTSDAKYQKLDPGGANRDITLPAEADSKGLDFVIQNAADGAENLVIKDDAASTVVTLNQNEAAIVVCNGTAWIHMGVYTSAIS